MLKLALAGFATPKAQLNNALFAAIHDTLEYGAGKIREDYQLMIATPRHLEPVEEPLNIEQFQDGHAYRIPLIAFTTTNRWMDIAFVDDLFIKLPSDRGILDYHYFLKLGHHNQRGLRGIRREERFELLEQQLEQYPEFRPLLDHYDADVAHYLLVYKMQHQRLKQSERIALPDTRFVVLEMEDFTGSAPAIIQKRVPGASLVEMYDFDNECIYPEWRPFLPKISGQLLRMIFSPLRKHVDWNIRNFVLSEAEQTLYYIDAKPSILVRKRRNRKNLCDMLEDFTVQSPPTQTSQGKHKNLTMPPTRFHMLESVMHPFKIQKFRDGMAYTIPPVEFVTTNVFMQLAFTDDVVIKLPTERTCDDYTVFLKPGIKNPRAVRALEREERFQHLNEMLERYPEFVLISERYHPDIAHYLLMFKMQYQRLQRAHRIHLPEMRFVLLNIHGMLDSGPTVIQERVRGLDLDELYDFDKEAVLPEWTPYLPAISEQILRLLHSELRDHIDWNPRNFMFCEPEQRLYYIDTKPTTIPSKPRNETNLEFLLKFFTI